jgi:hypothetical protein
MVLYQKSKIAATVEHNLKYFIRNDAHIQNTLQNVGIQKQEDLYKFISLIKIVLTFLNCHVQPLT